MMRPPEDLPDLAQRGYRFAYSLTHDAGRADDLLQDAWLSILKASGPFTIAYLLAAIRNRFVDACRRDSLIVFAPLDAVEEDSDPAAPYADDQAGVADRGLLERALAQVRVEQRAVLYLWAVEDYSAQEIADFFGWPRGTVLSHMRRGRQKLLEWQQSQPGARV